MIVSEAKLIANRLKALKAGKPKGSIGSARKYSIAVKAYFAERIYKDVKPITDALIKEAKAGNVIAFIALRDTAFGKPPQAVYQSDEEGLPIVFMPSALIEKYSLPTQDTSIVNSTEVTHEMVNVKKIDNGLVEPLKEK